LNGGRRDLESAQQRSPSAVDWETTYRQHDWDYLAGIAEVPRYSVVAGYAHKLARRGRILDAGCGEGVLLEYLDIDRFQYTGFDLSPTAIDRARRRYEGGNLLCCSLDDFTPLQGRRYDLIIFNEVLTSLKNSIAVLNRFYSFLQPSGHVIISQFQNSDPNSNAFIFTQIFEAEIAAGRYPVVATSEVLNCETGRRWRVYCLGDLPRAG
jgi:2-polyprenyl-3-methyl-5-hydroxy-6-metoxy-1,4-benzoquinol methylase